MYASTTTTDSCIYGRKLSLLTWMTGKTMFGGGNWLNLLTWLFSSLCLTKRRQHVACSGLKGTLLYGVGRIITEFNITDQRLMSISGDSTSLVVSVDVDSSRSYVYWVDQQRMRRAIIPKNSLQIAQTQSLCAVNNAQGVAIDWLTR